MCDKTENFVDEPIKDEEVKSYSELRMSPPWIEKAREFQMLFGQDPEINLVYDNEDVALKLYVDNPTKAEALDILLPNEYDFGNVKLKVSVIPSNSKELSEADLIARAFAGNPVLSSVETIDNVAGFSASYFLFKKEVVQYYNDMLDDPYGLVSTLYEDLARDIFEENTPGIFFSTDIQTPVDLTKLSDAPLGEWP